MTPNVLGGAANSHFHALGGGCTQVWKTGTLGTRRTRKRPAHSHQKLKRQKRL